MSLVFPKSENAIKIAAAAFALLVPICAFAQDATRGEAIFKKCAACHQIGEGAKNRTGPVLTGVVGRPAASVDGFKYSSSMNAAGQAGLVWGEALLVDYLSGPKEFLRAYLNDNKAKSKMPFRLKSEQERRDVVAYLASFSVAAVEPPKVCVRNASDHRHFFAAEATGQIRSTAWLDPGETLCVGADEEGAHGLVSVFETDEGFEGCSRLLRAGQMEDLVRYVDFDRCEWGSHAG